MAIDHFNGYCNGYDKWLMVKNSYDNPPIKRGFSGYPLVNDIEMTFFGAAQASFSWFISRK